MRWRKCRRSWAEDAQIVSLGNRCVMYSHSGNSSCTDMLDPLPCTVRYPLAAMNPSSFCAINCHRHCTSSPPKLCLRYHPIHPTSVDCYCHACGASPVCFQWTVPTLGDRCWHLHHGCIQASVGVGVVSSSIRALGVFLRSRTIVGCARSLYHRTSAQHAVRGLRPGQGLGASL